MSRSNVSNIKELVESEIMTRYGLTKSMIAKGRCDHTFHHNPVTPYNNLSALKYDDDGTCSCPICGYEFNAEGELSCDNIEEAVSNMQDTLQALKLLISIISSELNGYNVPEDVANAYELCSVLIPMIGQLPSISNDMMMLSESISDIRKPIVNNYTPANYTQPEEAKFASSSEKKDIMI